MVRKKFLNIIRLLLLVILAFSVIMSIQRLLQNLQASRNRSDALQLTGLDEAVSVSAGSNASTGPYDPQKPLLPPEASKLAKLRLEGLQEINSDVTGWIEIPGTPISYPLLLGVDGDYYLNNNWKKEASRDGSIFLDATSNPDLTNFHTLIHGHRILFSEEMFSTLERYKETEYWQEHPSIYLVIEDGIYRYDIFAAFEANARGAVYRLDLDDKREQFIEFCLESSVLKTDVKPLADERLLTLSTCTANNTRKRWVVQGVLREIYDRDPSVAPQP